MTTCRHLLLLGLTVILASLLAAREAAVAASATAGSDYQRPKDKDGNPLPETYVFAQGHYFEGGTVDGSLSRASFTDITRTLAAGLAKQSYFPTADVKSAHLLIMVHWGTTLIYEDPMKEINQQKLNEAVSGYNAGVAESGTADPSALNMALGDRQTAQDSAMGAVNRNAVLLGYARSLEKERKQFVPSTDEITMSNELNEERYFVILFAYDNQARLKDHQSKPLWITRLSVRAPGNNFTQALPDLVKVGSEVFGHQLDDLVRVKASMNPGKVTLGETQFLDAPDAKTPPAKTNK